VASGKFVHPDLMVVCGKEEVLGAGDAVLNPQVVVEVLSPKTGDYDYGGKFRLYQTLDSFEEYVLIAQDEPRVDVFRKTPDSRWLLSSYTGLSQVAKVESLGIELSLAQLYAGVEWTQSPST